MTQLFQTKCPAALRTLLVCATALAIGCKQQSYRSPQGYDLTSPVKEKLGKVLNEISGISFNSDNNTLLAISDNEEKIIQIDVNRGKLKDYTGKVVPKNSDIEEVVKQDSVIYMLSSKGIIYEVSDALKDTLGSYALPLSGKNDFETLYYDPSAKGLIMVCKKCDADKGDHQRSAFRFDPATKQFDPKPFYQFSTEAVKKMLNGDDAKFDPSAAAIHPTNKRLYVLSSAGNLLAIADTRGKILQVYPLNPEQFPQAEGIAFAPNGDMFVTNEGKLGSATLQIFKYQTGKNKK